MRGLISALIFSVIDSLNLANASVNRMISFAVPEFILGLSLYAVNLLYTKLLSSS